MANTTTHSAPPNRAARPLPRIRPEVDIAPLLSLPLTQGHDATERSSTPLQTAYSPECLERLYEKSSNSDEPPRHEANHRSVHERFSARTKSLVIFAHPPVLVDPSDRPLHHPPTR